MSGGEHAMDKITCFKVYQTKNFLSDERQEMRNLPGIGLIIEFDVLNSATVVKTKLKIPKIYSCYYFRDGYKLSSKSIQRAFFLYYLFS